MSGEAALSALVAFPQKDHQNFALSITALTLSISMYLNARGGVSKRLERHEKARQVEVREEHS